MLDSDHLHRSVRIALEKDGWEITHDPFRLAYAGRELGGTSGLLAADRAEASIAVTVFPNLGEGEMTDLFRAAGRHKLCELVLGQIEPKRRVFLAFVAGAREECCDEELKALLISSGVSRLLFVNGPTDEVQAWVT